MAKDPAMLWYWSDWNSGTTTFSRFLKGCYMDVLHAQFNSGHLTLEEIKTVLGSDFGQSWPTLQKKFAVDDTGKYFNVRLETEKEKRAAFTTSRKNNLHKNKHMGEHMQRHMDNENRNEDVDGFKYQFKEPEKKKIPPRETKPDSLSDAEYWTEQVIEGNDVVFMGTLRTRSIKLTDQLEPLARDHLDVACRYGWHKNWESQQDFRNSLFKHLNEKLNGTTQQGKTPTKKLTLKDLDP
jgi:hypothetical protein